MGTLAVAVEANLSGTAWTDLSQDVLQAPGLTLDWGMDGGRPDDNCARPGTLALTLTQASRLGGLQGRYAPGHANALAGFDLNTPLRVRISDGPNRLVNSGFESGLFPEWTKYDPPSEITHGVTATAPHSGTYCYYQTVGGTSTDVKGIQPTALGHVAWSPYRPYVISCWARLVSAGGADDLICGWVGTAPDTVTALTSMVLSTTWTRYAWRITWGATVNAVTPGNFIIYTNFLNNTITYDDLQVECGDTLTDWYDSTHRVCGPYRIVDLTPTPGQYREQQVSVLAADWLEEAAEAPVVYSGAINQTPEAVLTDLLIHMDRQPTATSFDAGASLFNYPLTDLVGRTNRVLAAFKSVAQSEGGFLYLTSAGTLRFEARSTRSGNTNDVYLLDNTMHGLAAERSREALVNAFNLTVHPPEVASSRSVLGAITTPFILAAGATVNVTLDYRDPTTFEPCGGMSIATPSAAAGDYAANTKADGTGTDKTTVVTVTYPFGGYPGASRMTYVVHNPDSVDCYVTALRVRGFMVLDRDPVTISSENASSIAAYGRKTVDIDMPYQSDPNVAQGLADYWRSLYSDATTGVRAVTLRIADVAAFSTLLLSVEVGRRINLTESMTAISHSYWVHGLTVQVAAGPVVDLTLRLAPASDALYWLLDNPYRSVLDSTTTLAYI